MMARSLIEPYFLKLRQVLSEILYWMRLGLEKERLVRCWFRLVLVISFESRYLLESMRGSCLVRGIVSTLCKLSAQLLPFLVRLVSGTNSRDKKQKSWLPVHVCRYFIIVSFACMKWQRQLASRLALQAWRACSAAAFNVLNLFTWAVQWS